MCCKEELLTKQSKPNNITHMLIATLILLELTIISWNTPNFLTQQLQHFSLNHVSKLLA